MKKILIITAILSAVAVTAKAQDTLETTIGTDVVSQYVWRGQDLGGVSVQPTLGLAYKGLSLSAWGSAGLSNPADTREVSAEEKKALWEEALKVIPLGRAQTGRDIAYSTAFMASDYAGEITGQCLCIDGGQTSGR